MIIFFYVALGGLCALFSDRMLLRLRAPLGERCLSAALCLGLWPLWAPIALTRKSAEPSAATAPELGEAREALADARNAVRGTPLEALLTEEVAHAIQSELEQLVLRQGELRRLIARSARSKGTSSQGDHAGAAQLSALAERDARRIDELVDLVGALRTRLVLARYSGASIEGVGDLLTELTTRVESLDELFDPAWRASPTPPIPAAQAGESAPPRESAAAPV